jgi:hypothetical protein
MFDPSFILKARPMPFDIGRVVISDSAFEV